VGLTEEPEDAFPAKERYRNEVVAPPKLAGAVQLRQP